MDYFKIEIEITPFGEWLRDVLTARLGEIGYESFVETETGSEAYIPVKNFNETALNGLLRSFNKKFSFRIKKELIKSRNWNEVWEKNYFKPLVIGGECLVRAPFHKDYPTCRYEIIIEPNMAFGTGNHETTFMMIEAILKENFTRKKVLDMGCGTGILGILASMKNASEITAIDIDDWAVKGTHENATLNHIKNLKVFKGDASKLSGEEYDFIFANIHKNVLINDLPAYAKCLNKNGKLIISGFYTKDTPELNKKAEQVGLKETGFKSKNNWAVSVFLKT